MKYILAFTLAFTTIQGVAQRFSMDAIHDGRVMLLEGDTAKGKIKYDFEKDVIQFAHGNPSEEYIFSSQQILGFEIIDKLTNQYRQFYSLPYDVKNNNYKVPVLFEILVPGSVSLLVREKLEYASNSAYGMQGRVYNVLQTVYTFYFLKDDGEIILFTGKKKDLKGIMGDHYSDISRFIKSNRLKLESRRDMAKIVNYYNSLTEQNN